MKNLWLTFGGNTKTLLEGYCNLDWASQAHHHSISGFSFHYGSGAIYWSWKKQNIVALSSTESEYVALTHAGKEAVWLKTFVSEIANQKIGPLTIADNNQGSLDLAKDNKFHSRTKHIDLRYHFIREAVEGKEIKLEYVPTGDNITDIFTKALAQPNFVEMLGLADKNK